MDQAIPTEGEVPAQGEVPAVVEAPKPKTKTTLTSIDEPTKSELARFRAFIFIQFLFLGASPLTGGFHYSFWSMMDTALLVMSIGLSALTFVIETRDGRRLVFRTAAIIYVMGVIDMAVNILMSGVVGWKGAVE